MTTSLSDLGIHPSCEAVRESARSDAAALIAQGPGALTEAQARQIFQYLTIDTNDAGAVVHNRYGVGLVGHTVNQLVSQLPALSRWIEALRTAPIDDAASAAGRLWAAADLKWAGRILPSAILHTRDPERFLPWTDAMGAQLGALTGADLKGPRTAAAYQRYCDAGVAWAQEQGVPMLLVDKAMARLAKDAPASAAVSEEALTIPADAFVFLTELQDNNNKQWFDQNRARYRDALRGPLIQLVVRLGEAYVEPVLNEGAPPELLLETRPHTRHTISRINKNNYGVGDPYWTHFWAAFYPQVDGKKNGAVQLFLIIYPHGFEVGFYSSEAALSQKLAQALRDPVLRRAAFKALSPLLGGLSFDHSGEGLVQRKEWLVSSEEELAVWADSTSGELAVRRQWLPADPVLRDGSLPQVVAEVFRAVYPLLVLTQAADPLPVLQAFIGEDIDEDDDSSDDTPAALPSYTAEHLADDGGFSPREVQEMVDSACYALDDPDRKGQLILYGPPGTGKTWLARRIAWAVLGERTPPEDSRIRQVQFHPAYGYEDFVEGLRPSLSETAGGLRFQRVDGILRRIVKDARARPGDHFILLIDEINRADLPRVFGELMFLLSQRESHVLLPISEERFRLPPNLTLIGTMNTADRSISHIDAALRRRFRFFHIAPSEEVLQRHIERLGLDTEWGERVLALFRHVNGRLQRELGPGRTLGHAWFLRKRLDEAVLASLWKREILPLIEDYFDGEPEQVQAYRLSTLLQAVDAS
ncbi:MAG: 5-methylcytosine-specific restriction protein B [Myxococcota bacterium]